jgi:nitrogen regulatory protein PII
MNYSKIVILQHDWRDGMKVIEAIINSASLDEVKTALQNMGIEKILVSHFVNKGHKKGSIALHKSAEYMVGFMTKLRVEIVTGDDTVGRVIETIGEIARRERRGDCRILIHPFIEAAIYST